MLDVIIKTEHPRVEELLERYRTAIGNDFEGYRNHVYRTVTYAMHFFSNAPEQEHVVNRHSFITTLVFESSRS